jgi:hypothetical protein
MFWKEMRKYVLLVVLVMVSITYDAAAAEPVLTTPLLTGKKTVKVKAKFIRTGSGVKYRNSDGTYVTKTWQCIKGHWYYFYSTGYMATSRQIGKFYVNKQGQMVTSKWVWIGKKKYYYGADGRLKKKVRIA